MRLDSIAPPHISLDRDASFPAAVELMRSQRLLDVYGALLTAHQREACRLRLEEDWSFAELAEALGVSRAGAHDLVRRALAQLASIEDRLGLAAELARRDDVEAGLRARLGELEGRSAARTAEASGAPRTQAPAGPRAVAPGALRAGARRAPGAGAPATARVGQ